MIALPLSPWQSVMGGGSAPGASTGDFGSSRGSLVPRSSLGHRLNLFQRSAGLLPIDQRTKTVPAILLDPIKRGSDIMGAPPLNQRVCGWFIESIVMRLIQIVRGSTPGSRIS